MATLWIHTASLLLLLVMTYPSTEATALQQLCGSHLVDALFLVCGDKGFFYNPGTSNGRVQGRAASAGVENEDTAFKGQMAVMPKRGILETCCHRPCNIYELANYCN